MSSQTEAPRPGVVPPRPDGLDSTEPGPAVGRRRRRWWTPGRLTAIGVSLVAIAALVMIARAGSRSPLGPDPQGELAPDFALPLLDGSGTLGLSDLRGTPVVLNFWASWCGPCKDEAAVLAAGWERWAPEGVVFLGVNVRDSKTWAREFEAEHGIEYQSVVDQNGEVTAAYGVLGYPESFFIDRDGRIVTKYMGPLDAPTLDSHVAAILDGR